MREAGRVADLAQKAEGRAYQAEGRVCAKSPKREKR